MNCKKAINPIKTNLKLTNYTKKIGYNKKQWTIPKSSKRTNKKKSKQWVISKYNRGLIKPKWLLLEQKMQRPL